MNDPEPTTVVDREGLHGVIELSAQASGRDDGLWVRLPDGERVLAPRDLLFVEPDGSFHLSACFAELPHGTATVAYEGDKLVIPVIDEQLRVHKREVVTGKVRVKKVMQEREEVVDEPLLSEDVEVKRVPIDRWVDSPVSVRQEGDTLIIPLLEEVLVVEKRLHLKEEIHVTRRRSESHRPERVVLRSEEALVDRLDVGGSAEADEANR
jgi:uncharacterized protein (TIGR02271 family)